MSTEQCCDVCKMKMHRIGPTLEQGNQGEPPKESEYFFDYECINSECRNNGLVVQRTTLSPQADL